MGVYANGIIRHEFVLISVSICDDEQVKSTSFEWQRILGSISLGKVVWHTQHRNLGFRTTRSVKTFYFGRLLMRYATAKVSTFFQRFTCTLSPHHFEVLRQCALEKGLELFEAVANTEVGEKGLTLVKKDQWYTLFQPELVSGMSLIHVQVLKYSRRYPQAQFGPFRATWWRHFKRCTSCRRIVLIQVGETQLNLLDRNIASGGSNLSVG